MHKNVSHTNCLFHFLSPCCDACKHTFAQDTKWSPEATACLPCNIIKKTYPGETWQVFCEANAASRGRQKDNAKAQMRLEASGFSEDDIDPANVDSEVSVGYYVKRPFNVYSDIEFRTAFGMSLEQAGLQKNATLTNELGEEEEVLAVPDEKQPRQLILVSHTQKKLSLGLMSKLLRPGQAEDIFDHVLKEEFESRGFDKGLARSSSVQHISDIVTKRQEDLQNSEALVETADADGAEGGAGLKSRSRWFGKKSTPSAKATKATRARGRGKGSGRRESLPSSAPPNCTGPTARTASIKGSAAIALELSGLPGVSVSALSNRQPAASATGGSQVAASVSEEERWKNHTFNFDAVLAGLCDRNVVSGVSFSICQNTAQRSCFGQSHTTTISVLAFVCLLMQRTLLPSCRGLHRRFVKSFVVVVVVQLCFRGQKALGFPQVEKRHQLNQCSGGRHRLLRSLLAVQSRSTPNSNSVVVAG